MTHFNACATLPCTRLAASVADVNKGFDCRGQKATVVLAGCKLGREPRLLGAPLGMNGGFAQPSSRPTSAEKTFASLTRSPLKGKGNCGAGGNRGGLRDDKGCHFSPLEEERSSPKRAEHPSLSGSLFLLILFNKFIQDS